jgi:uncharacterized lipoprotein NlpE involved in copper resistance
MKKTILAALTAIALISLISCANRHQSPILIERGIPEDERSYDVVQEGYGIDPELKKSFLAGCVTEGMNQNLVHLLWGTPDKESSDRLNWEYINVKTGEVIARLKWENTNYKGADWTNNTKLLEIEGDRSGGSPHCSDY